MFDPFFTTKEVGRGTGQGLAIARTIITERHNGAITFTTSPGHGTTFEVRLPIGVTELATAGADAYERELLDTFGTLRTAWTLLDAEAEQMPRDNAPKNDESPASARLLRATGATGLEPATSGVTGRRSNQLSYAPLALREG